MRQTTTKKKSHQIDMLNGSLAKNMIVFSLPLAASTILEQLFNSADVAVAGNFAGSNALAAVGANAPIVSLFVSILSGLALGSNVIIARLVGERNTKRISTVIHTAISLSIFCGLLMMVLGLILSRPLLTLISTPADVLDQAALYLHIYCLCLPFVMFYNFGAAILRSIGDTRRPLFILIAAGIINVCLNLFFVIVFKMGVAGVGCATLISNAFSSAVILRILLKEDEPFRLHLKSLRFDKGSLISILKIGAPAALQSGLFSISNIIVQSGINSFGSDAVAGSSAGLNFEYFTYYIVNSFAQAVVTFTSQNYGAGNKKRCNSTYIIGMIESMGFTALVSSLIVIFRNYLVLFYTSDPAVIKYAISRLMLITAFEALTALYEIAAGSIRGLGNSLLPALITIIGTVVFRVFWMNVIFLMNPTYEMIMLLYIVSWLLTGSIMIIAYFIFRRKAYRTLNLV